MNTCNLDPDEDHIFEFHVRNACMSSHLPIIQEYLESHDINNFLYDGWTLLLFAASYTQAETIHYLIQSGADVNKHKDGYTPLMALCSSTRGTIETKIKCLTLLMKAKANVNASNKQRQTSLMWACSSQEPEFVEELLKYANNINACDSRNQTALMYATIANKPDIVKILIEKGVDTTLTDYSNLTAKEIASLKGYDEILSLLNFDEEEIVTISEMSKICDWTDMFPVLSNIKTSTIDFDVSTILNAMGLEQYTHNFEGMSLRDVLQLNEDNLCNLNIDIKAHRSQFMQQLHKFHKKKWNVNSIGLINTALPYTIYDGIIFLGTIAKHIAVIGSSYQYIKNGILEANNENINFTSKQISSLVKILNKTQKSLCSLKKELILLKELSETIKRQNDIGIPATYIGPKKHNSRWLPSISIMTIIGIFIFKRTCIQKLITK
ncbi:uncharacterized protein LOC143259310 isoform X2 [Megalopta genalis]